VNIISSSPPLLRDYICLEMLVRILRGIENELVYLYSAIHNYRDLVISQPDHVADNIF